MAFIKTQNVRRDESGAIVSGSAAILDTRYDSKVSGHSRHSVRESLGKVIALSEDKRSGIFLSPTRGLVSYDATKDIFEHINNSDPRVAGQPRVPEPPMHTDFGAVYLFTSLLKKGGWIDLLKRVFSKAADYERLLAHVTHVFLRDGSRIKCDTFIAQSALSSILTSFVLSTLRCDTRFFEKMGQDGARMRFFEAYVSMMRKRVEGFGHACYVDSTPLPDDIADNPYNALRCEAGKGCSVEIRLAMVLDDITGLPVWYQLVPGNLMDVSTLKWISEDVRDSLGIEICSVVVDAGYVCEGLIRQYGDSDGERTMIARMPNRKGYHYKTLYHKIKDQIDRGKYDFVRNSHVYFGRRLEDRVFDTDLFAYVYVDKERALREYRAWRIKHEDEFENLKERDKRWRTISSGYFVLLSNIKDSPSGMLERYLKRVDIELIFKTAKSFEGLLPLAKWNDTRVRGKILLDVIDTMLRAEMLKLTRDSKESVMDLFHDAASIGCFCHDGELRIETPNKQARNAYAVFDNKAPLSLKLEAWSQQLGIT